MGARDNEEDGQQTPLLISNRDDEHFQRTGTFWTAVAHIITGVIGSGVLSLAWSIAQLGWIAGPAAMVIFAGITVVSSFLLSDAYRSPDPENGITRNRSYMDAVRFNLGKRSIWVCGLFQQTSLYGCGVTYTITSAISMRSLKSRSDYTCCSTYRHPSFNYFNRTCCHDIATSDGKAAAAHIFVWLLFSKV